MKKGFSPSSGWNVSETPKPPEPVIQKAFKVYNFIVSKGGEIELSHLVKPPSPLQKLEESEALQWLVGFIDQTDSNQFEKPCFVVKTDPQGRVAIVQIWMRVKLCCTYEKKGSCKHGGSCLQWHICRGFLEGNCKNPSLCSRSHDLLDAENIEKAKKYKLEKHSSESIRKVLVKNLPFVCETYTSNRLCQDGRCPNLHICPQLVRGQCADNVCSLGLSHDLNSPKNKEIFKSFAVPAQYLLYHVLLPKMQIPDQEVKPSIPENQVENQSNRKKKVVNLNNLDVEETKLSKPDTQPLNISEPKDSHSKKSQRQKNLDKVHLQREIRGEIRREQVRSSEGYHREERPPGRQNVHQPLMSIKLQESTPPSVDAYSSQQPHRQASQNRQKMNDFSFSGARPKMQKQVGSAVNQNNGDQSSDHNNGGDNESCTKGVKKKKSKGGKSKLRETEDDPSLVKSMSLEGLSLQECTTDDTADQNNQPKRGRNRRCGRKPKSDESFRPSTSDIANMDKDKEDENDNSEIDLIEFDDLQDSQEGQLIDLDFNSDQCLSQMSETHSQAMWDLFSQDQLYEDFGLSQPVEFNQLTPMNSHEISTEDKDQSSSEAIQADKIKNASEIGVFNCIVLHFGGTAKFSEILKNQDIWHPEFKDQEKWFRRRRSSFLLVEDSSGNIEEVKAISFKARLCFRYTRKECNEESCPYFHVCQEYIAKGRCSNFNGSCKKNHGFKDAHNKGIAEKLFPGNPFNNKHLKQLIKSSTPQVCLDYNNHRCNRGKLCTKVHICKNYGHIRCPKSKCKLAHDNAFKFPETKALLAKFRIRLPPKVSLYMVARSQLLVCEDEVSTPVQPARKSSEDTIPKEKPTVKNDGSKDECVIKTSDLDHPICLAFLLGQCPKGKPCTDHHCSLPYQWVYKTGKHWKKLDERENADLEESFCQIFNDQPVYISLKLDLSANASKLSHLHNIPYIYTVDLKKMEIGLLDDDNISFQLKRLSTESQVLKPECPLTTSWNWYWKDENDLYTEYKPSEGSKDPTSSTIEKFYQEGMSKYAFKIGSHEYQLYFAQMYQKNMDPQYLTQRDVIRRPLLLTPEKVDQLKRNCQLPTPDQRKIPEHWKTMAKSQPFFLKKLNKASKEFKEIQSLFMNSMGDRQPIIESIRRVQNPFMWEKYQRKKSQMETMASSTQLDERSLFHGTSYRNIRSICRENFDWRLYGEITGNIYGEGAYFARDASFSHCYCHDDEDGMRYVFVAKVLVGSFTKGEKNYRRPPYKDPSDPHSNFFDSCVDDVDSPKVFVVFDVDQYYPGHVIAYECHSPESSSDLTNASTRKVSNSSNVSPYSSSQSINSQSGSTYPSNTIYGISASDPATQNFNYAPSQPPINRSVSMPEPDVMPTAHGFRYNHPSTSYSNEPTVHPYSSTSTSRNVRETDATAYEYGYNDPPTSYSNQPTVHPYRHRPLSEPSHRPVLDLTDRRIKMEVGNWNMELARASKKSDDSKQNCVVM